MAQNPIDAPGHWNAAYERAGESGVSWFQDEAQASLDLLDELQIPSSASVVDAGGGASRLVDGLLARGHRDVTVVDVSATGLMVAQNRLAQRAGDVEWVVADLLGWQPRRRFDVWHDRAVFHFLVEPADRQRYLDVLRSATGPGSRVLMGTFALDGPERCSGLPVARYDAATLHAVLGPEFALTVARRQEHRTPGDATQAFVWAAFVRT